MTSPPRDSSFYQSEDYAAALTHAGRPWFRLSYRALAAEPHDGALEIWEAPIATAAEAAALWDELLALGRARGSSTVRLALPIGMTRPGNAAFATVLAPTDDEGILRPSYARAARRVRPHVRVEAVAFDAGMYRDTVLATAREREFLAETDDAAVLAFAAARGRVAVLTATTNGTLAASVYMLRHGARLELRYAWRAPKLPSGVMQLLWIEAWRHTRAAGVPFFDLGGVPAPEDERLSGIRAWKLGLTSCPIALRGGFVRAL